MSTYSTNSVTVVGHSLGGAIALLDGVYLDLQLPSATVSVISYGMPRVRLGNWHHLAFLSTRLTHLKGRKSSIRGLC